MKLISPHCAIVCDFHHVVHWISQCCPFLVMRCCWGIILVLLLGWCTDFVGVWNWLWISLCCVIVCEFHHVVQLFVYFTMLCNYLCILPCCAIVCVFHHVVQLFVYFTMLCNCLCIVCCLGVVGMLLRCHYVLWWYFLKSFLPIHWPTEPFPELLPQLKIWRVYLWISSCCAII